MPRRDPNTAEIVVGAIIGFIVAAVLIALFGGWMLMLLVGACGANLGYFECVGLAFLARICARLLFPRGSLR